MKRLALCGALCLAIFAGCLCGVGTITRVCDEMCGKLERIETLCENGSAELTAACAAAESRWNEFEPKLTFFVDHDTARTIGESIAMLEPLSTVEDKSELRAQCRAARTKLLHLKGQESPSLRNVF